MRKDFEKLFTHFVSLEPPENLLPQIMKRIHHEQQTVFKWRLAFFAVMLIGSAAAAVPAFQMAKSALAESGFTQFLSLLFFDVGSVMVYWDSFAVALLESFPIISITIFLAVIFAFLESIKFVTRDIRSVFAFSNIN